ncbi:hypothetical protein PVT68_16125 [Microbulbifer bruguierae]|uniref:Uncharacterized protein n=1 Tax=Microbulbifer bruguierae TaxID=3029061 RepID=A0ABY8NDW9_9GAMM|nr:hypothetical protein [Microbulbifer bruguierae]WGL16282.1 hypothetical protein PVT68_16125 [Microbulbifer bruguierae]
MNRNEFLSSLCVDDFISWLIEKVPTLEFELNFAQSRYVPSGLNMTVLGLEEVLSNYCWSAYWDAEGGERVRSSDWKSTRSSLERLSQWMQMAVEQDDDHSCYLACLAILQWGGVRGAKPFLKGLYENGDLIKYFSELVPLFDLTGHQSYTALNSENVLRFDAGLTKIHSLLDKTGSPIYDSRVGAAMAMLYALYCSDRDSDPELLCFPSGSARGDQIRNPAALGYQYAPQFFTTDVTDESWAQWQLKLGWIIRETLTRCNWFSGENDLRARCHGFEAALFMIGYDLRCFECNNEFALA